MLATALAFHGLAMSGGVLDAVERMSPDVENIEDAFQWLGLDGVSSLLASVRQDIAAGVLDDDDLADGLERDADERYGVLLPSDAVLNAAFRARLKEAPDAFADPSPMRLRDAEVIIAA
jgi:hypothetical protein